MRALWVGALIVIVVTLTEAVHAEKLKHLAVAADPPPSCSSIKNQTLCGITNGCAYCYSNSGSGGRCYNVTEEQCCSNVKPHTLNQCMSTKGCDTCGDPANWFVCYNLTDEQCCPNAYGASTFSVCPSKGEGGSCCQPPDNSAPICCGNGSSCCSDQRSTQCCLDSEDCCHSMGSEGASCCPKIPNGDGCCGNSCCSAARPNCCGDYNVNTWCCGPTQKCGPTSSYQCVNETGEVVHVVNPGSNVQSTGNFVGTPTANLESSDDFNKKSAAAQDHP